MHRCLASLLLLVCATAHSQTAWRMSGKVVDAGSGQPVARCVVEINPTTERGASLSVMTGDDGRFAFAGLALGKYHLSAARRGYLTQSYQEHGDFSTAVAVGPGLSSEDLLFQLTPQSMIYGTVTDEAGDPIRQAQVRIYGDQGRNGMRSTLSRESAMTDDLGKYEIAEIPPGNYYLAVTAQPWYALRANQVRSVPAAEEHAEDAPDSPLNVAYPTTFYPNVTDSDEATPIPLRGGEHLEMNMTLNEQHALRLRVSVPHLAGAHMNMAFTRSVFGQPEWVSTGLELSESGEAEVEGLLPGHYDVTVTQLGSGPSGPAQFRSTQFTADVADGATTLSPAETLAEVTVTGKVSGLGGKIANAGVTLASSHPPRNYYAPLDDSGEFSVKVEPGEYEVIGQIAQMYLARVESANTPVHGRIVAVKNDTSPRLDIVAGKGFGQIDGFVTLGNQKPGGVLVLLAPEHPKDNQILFRRDQSDSDGSFTLYNVIPGHYRLIAVDRGWDLDWGDPNVLDAFAKKGIPILVHEGEKIRQSVEAQPQ